MLRMRLGLGFAFTLYIISVQAFALDAIKEAEDRRQVDSITLKDAVDSIHSKDRQRAAIALGRIQKPQSVDPLMRLLKDRNEKVVREAVFALGQLGWDGSFSGGREEEISKRLLPLLKHRSSMIRKTAVEALGKLGLLKTPHYVLPALSDLNSEVRSEAVIALYRFRLVSKLRDSNIKIPDLFESVMSKVLNLSTDGNEKVRRSVAYYFARVRDVRSAKYILKLAKDRDIWVRYFAVNALAKSEGKEAVTAAITASRDKHYFTRVAALQAINALKEYGDFKLSLIARLSNDPSNYVRATLAEILGNVSPAEPVLTVLKGLQKDQSVLVKSQALAAVLRLAMGNADLLKSTLTDAMKDPSWVVRETAVSSLSDLSDNAILQSEILAKATVDIDVRVRAAAISVFSGIEGSEAFQSIVKGLKSEALSERGSAIDALNARKESEVALVAWDCYKNSADEKWAEMREAIVALLASIQTDESTGYLRDATKDPVPSVSLAAIKELKNRGIKDLPQEPKVQLSFSPYRELKFKRNPKIVFETTKGRIVLELFRKAQIHVANIVGFIRNGGYNGLPIHRVVPNFVIQGGDPDGTGWGGAGYLVRAEVNSIHFDRGTLGMPRSQGFDTGGVQFFITHVPTPNLDGQYTVFGKVIHGMDVVDQTDPSDTILNAWVD